MSTSYIDEVSERIKSRFTEEEIATVEKVLRIMSDELMPELDDIRNIKV